VNHEEVQTILTSIPAERMDAHTRRAVDQHLAGCAQCRQMAQFTGEVEEAVAGLRSTGSSHQVLQRIKHGTGTQVLPVARSSSSSRKGSRRRASASHAASRQSSQWGSFAAAASVLVLLGVGVLALQKPKTPLTNGAQPATPKIGENDTAYLNHRNKVERISGNPAAPAPAPKPAPVETVVADDDGYEAPAPVVAVQEPARTWVPTNKEEEIAFAEEIKDPPPAAARKSGTARLRTDTEKFPDSDTLSLTDGAIGLHIMDSDLRVQRASRDKVEPELLSVAMGGFDKSSLIDLSNDAKGLETRSLELKAGLRCMLHVERSGQSYFYIIKVAAYKAGEFADLEWSVVAPAEAHNIVKPLAEARLPRRLTKPDAHDGKPEINAKPAQDQPSSKRTIQVQ
jgi:hypothetical protein